MTAFEIASRRPEMHAADPAVVERIVRRYRGVKVEVVAHPAYEGRDSAKVAAILGVDPRRVIKALVLKAKDAYAVFVIPADARLNMRRAAEVWGVPKKRIRLATEEELQALGYRPGAVPLTIVRGLSIPGFVEESLLALDFIIGSSGEPHYGVRLDPKELLSLGYKPARLCT